MQFAPHRNLFFDPIHGYIPFASRGSAKEPSCERNLIDSLWVQRLRSIRQLQTAHWVFPSAEHTRFQHVVGAMHLASRMFAAVEPSLRATCPDAPSPGYLESLLRVAGLLHDVGHGPFGHFFDTYYLTDYGLTHETLGARIVVEELGDRIAGIRRTPSRELEPGETLDPRQVAWLIQRPRSQAEESDVPKWLRFLRSLLCGIYTIDNLDFVLRDAYMTGYSTKAYDLERLLEYTFFTEAGLTIHDRGMDALLRFMGVRGELFRAIYFHRTVRAIDLTLADLFLASKRLLFPGDPSEHRTEYRRFTDFSLLAEVERWEDEPGERGELGRRWRRLLEREVEWKLAAQTNLVFQAEVPESSSIFSDPDFVERKLRAALPRDKRDIPLRVDVPRHSYRPHASQATSGQNFFYDSSRDRVRPLDSHQLFRELPVVHRICRVYVQDRFHGADVAAALERVAGSRLDDLTNM